MDQQHPQEWEGDDLQLERLRREVKALRALSDKLLARSETINRRCPFLTDNTRFGDRLIEPVASPKR
ncbi:MAG TPA: hypothetical protein VGN72_02375 [Tepidisphaeraceae bacterium]|nr:hypothetical protein [Tepidisphaeraceae bacterium]